ncbi:conserved hypothetical protein [Neospora caninum Liverpool]|nr:conserved hypothetical protein [Neospora caninum Liverpool]CBZ50087.1 conserved hypothetical protein [Neospora caninum Liverpool]|eukprot:XP_003880122.1 conserved hypothetical protein [Neospora caninum Liverpool]
MSPRDAVRAYVLLRRPPDDLESASSLRGRRPPSSDSARSAAKPASPSVSRSRDKENRLRLQPLTPAEEKRLQEGAVTSLSLRLCSGSLHILQLTKLLRRFTVDAPSKGTMEPANPAKAGQGDTEGDALLRKAEPSPGDVHDDEDDADGLDSGDDEASGAPNAFARKAQRRRRAALLLGEVLQRVPSLPLSDAVSASPVSPPTASARGLSPRTNAGMATERLERREKNVAGAGSGDATPREACGAQTSSWVEEHDTLSELVAFCLENINDWYVVEGACTALLAILTHHRTALKSRRLQLSLDRSPSPSEPAACRPCGDPDAEHSEGEAASSCSLADGQATPTSERAGERGGKREEAEDAGRAGKPQQQKLIQTILRRVLVDVHAPSFAQNVRQLILRLILALLRDFETDVAALATRKRNEGGVDVVTAVCAQLEGERDPRCLLLVFEIVSVLGSRHSSIMKRADLENVVDVAMTYFPISFNPPANAPMPITEAMLVSAFHKALTASPLFSSFVLLYLMDALASAGDEDFQQTLEDVKQTATAVLPFFPPSAVLAILQPLQGLMLQSCFDAPSVHTPQLVALWALFLKRALQVEDAFNAEESQEPREREDETADEKTLQDGKAAQGETPKRTEDDPAAEILGASLETCGEPEQLTSSSASAASSRSGTSSRSSAGCLSQVRLLLEELFAPLLDPRQPTGGPACVAARQFLLRSALASAAVCRMSLETCILPLLKLTLASCPSPFSSQTRRKGSGQTLAQTEETCSPPQGGRGRCESASPVDDAAPSPFSTQGAGDPGRAKAASDGEQGEPEANGSHEETDRARDETGGSRVGAVYGSDGQEEEELQSAWDMASARIVSTVHTVERFLTTCIAAGLLANEVACPPTDAGLVLLRLLSLFRRARCHLILRRRTATFPVLFQAIAEVAALPQQLLELREATIRLFASVLGFVLTGPASASSPASTLYSADARNARALRGAAGGQTGKRTGEGEENQPVQARANTQGPGSRTETKVIDSEQAMATRRSDGEADTADAQKKEDQAKDQQEREELEDARTFQEYCVSHLEMAIRLEGVSSLVTNPSSLVLGLLRALQQVLLARREVSRKSLSLSHVLEGIAVERNSATEHSSCVLRCGNDRNNLERDAGGRRVSGSSECTPEDSASEAGVPAASASEPNTAGAIRREFADELSSLPASLLPRILPDDARRSSGECLSVDESLATSLSRVIRESGTALLRESLPFSERKEGSRSLSSETIRPVHKRHSENNVVGPSSLLSLVPTAVCLEISLAISAVLLGRSSWSPSAFATLRSRSGRAPFLHSSLFLTSVSPPSTTRTLSTGPTCPSLSSSTVRPFTRGASCDRRGEKAAGAASAAPVPGTEDDASFQDLRMETPEGNSTSTAGDENALDELQLSIAALFVASAAQAAGTAPASLQERRETPDTKKEERELRETPGVAASVLRTVTQCVIAWLRIAQLCEAARAREDETRHTVTRNSSEGREAGEERGARTDRSHAPATEGVCTAARVLRDAMPSSERSLAFPSCGPSRSGAGETAAEDKQWAPHAPFAKLLLALQQAVCAADSTPSAPCSDSLLPHLRCLVDLLLHTLPAGEAKALGVSLLSLAAGPAKCQDNRGEPKEMQTTDAERGDDCILLLAPAVLPFLTEFWDAGDSDVPAPNAAETPREVEGRAGSDLSSLLAGILDRCISLTDMRSTQVSLLLSRDPSTVPPRHRLEEKRLSEKAVLEVVEALLYFAPDARTLRRLLASLDAGDGPRRGGEDAHREREEERRARSRSSSCSPAERSPAPWEREAQATLWRQATVKMLFLRQERHACEEDLASARLRELLLPVFSPLDSVGKGRSSSPSTAFDASLPSRRRGEALPGALPALWRGLSSSLAVARLLGDPIERTTQLLRREGECGERDADRRWLGRRGESRHGETQARATDPRRNAGLKEGGRGGKDKGEGKARNEESDVLPGLLPLLPCPPPSVARKSRQREPSTAPQREEKEREVRRRGFGEAEEETFLHFHLADMPLKCVARRVLDEASSAVCTLRGQLVARGLEAASRLASPRETSPSPLQVLFPQACRGGENATFVFTFRVRLATLPAAACLARAAACLPVPNTLLHGVDDACTRQASPSAHLLASPGVSGIPQPQRGLLATVVLWAISLYFANRAGLPSLHPLTRGLLQAVKASRKAPTRRGGRTSEPEDAARCVRKATSRDCGVEAVARDNASFAPGNGGGLSGSDALSDLFSEVTSPSGIRQFDSFLCAVEEAEDVLLASTLLLLLSAQRRKLTLRGVASQRAVLAASPSPSAVAADAREVGQEGSARALAPRSRGDAETLGQRDREAPVAGAGASGQGAREIGEREKVPPEAVEKEHGKGRGKDMGGRETSSGGCAGAADSSHALEEMELQFLDQFVDRILPFLIVVAQQGGREEVEEMDRLRRKESHRGGSRRCAVPKGGFAAPLLRLLALQAIINFADRPLGGVLKMQKEVIAGVSPALDDPVRVVRRAAAVCKNRWAVFE